MKEASLFQRFLANEKEEALAELAAEKAAKARFKEQNYSDDADDDLDESECASLGMN